MSFMEPQITQKMRWHRVEWNGVQVFPADDWTAEDVAEECQCPLDNVETIEGFGARLSAPGYMDCTEWAVFDSMREASKHLVEMFCDCEYDNGEDFPQLCMVCKLDAQIADL